MNKKLIQFMLKIASSVAKIIMNQITEYISSEEFKSTVKLFIKTMVAKIVAIVMKEKTNTVK
ncbi:hypothetical protein [Vagococcus bubulae]|uniref:hypothetical protein n=1 Tax=Vagococcus bubulae TaxID=1977868 RepID=UPI0022E97B0A|nr:hypothetical protein [Vagococcus bubulae]